MLVWSWFGLFRTTTLNKWLDVAAGCGWIEVDSDRHARRGLYLALGLDEGALTHWLAFDQDQPVGFASSYLEVNVIDLCNLGVAQSYRLAGSAEIAIRLASTRISPGAVIADTCFYLPI
jgi:hypothetical protein